VTANAPASVQADFTDNFPDDFDFPDISQLRVSTSQLGPAAQDTVSINNNYPYNTYMDDSGNTIPPDASGSADANFSDYIQYDEDNDGGGAYDEAGQPSSTTTTTTTTTGNPFICTMTNSKGQVCNRDFPRLCDLK